MGLFEVRLTAGPFLASMCADCDLFGGCRIGLFEVRLTPKPGLLLASECDDCDLIGGCRMGLFEVRLAPLTGALIFRLIPLRGGGPRLPEAIRFLRIRDGALSSSLLSLKETLSLSSLLYLLNNKLLSPESESS